MHVKLLIFRSSRPLRSKDCKSKHFCPCRILYKHETKYVGMAYIHRRRIILYQEWELKTREKRIVQKRLRIAVWWRVCMCVGVQTTAMHSQQWGKKEEANKPAKILEREVERHLLRALKLALSSTPYKRVRHLVRNELSYIEETTKICIDITVNNSWFS